MNKLTEEEIVYVCEKCEYRQLYTSRKPFVEIFCLGCKSYRLFNLPNSLTPEGDAETEGKLTEEECNEEEFMKGTLEAMYCSSCQALHELECICEDEI